MIYEWDVPVDRQAAFFEAWEETTLHIRETTEGARGSFCIVGIDNPSEVLTIARWDELSQWQGFIKSARHSTMKKMHELGEQRSYRAFEMKGDTTC